MLVGDTTKALNSKAFPLRCNARTVKSVDEGRKVFGMAGRKGWTITGVDERGRAEAGAAAERAGVAPHAGGEQGGGGGPPPPPGPAPPPGGGDGGPQAPGRGGGGGGGGGPGGGR